MKKYLILGLLMLGLGVQTTLAAQTTSFIVEVNPKSASINQAVDLTIKAVDANGAVNMDYAETIFIDVPDIWDLQDIITPSDVWVYSFSPEDQWSKTFSKWLTFKVAWTYTVSVFEIQDESIKGQTKITISSSAQPVTSTSEITLSSPLPDTTETSSVISVIGNAVLPNAKVQVFIDGEKMSEGQSTANGDFAAYLTDVTAWAHTLVARVFDINNEVIAESNPLTFSYKTLVGGDLWDLQVLPSKTLKQWQKATFSIKTDVDVTSIELTLQGDNWKSMKLMMDKMKEGVFQKQLLMDEVGVYTVNADYVNEKEKKSATNIATVSVLEWKWIKEVTHLVAPIDKDTIQVSVKPIGSFDYILVKYWTEQEAMNSSVVFSGFSWSIIDVNPVDFEYYIRVFPADASGNILWEPSDIILVEKVKWSAPLCRVNGITISTRKVGDKYFLTWDSVENAERYIIYRSDRQTNSVSEMQKVGETSDNKFPYPFDPESTSDVYAYYAVVAMCQDGSSIQVDNTKQVKVGPATNMLIVLLLSLMVFGIYKMRKVESDK